MMATISQLQRKAHHGAARVLEDNHMGWSAAMVPSIMGNPDRLELGEELTNSFCRTDPEIATAFARVTFTADKRGDLSTVPIPT
jgi:sigma-B regulation protein RsbQ